MDYLKPAFGIALVAAAITGLLAAGQGGVPGSVWTLPFLGSFAATLGLGAARLRAYVRPARTGALTRRRRPPFSGPERASKTAMMTFAKLSYKQMFEASGGNPPLPDRIIMDALKAMRSGWGIAPGTKPGYTDDEIRSEFQLWMYAAPLREGKADPDTRFLTDVARLDIFTGLRDALVRARTEKGRQKAARAAWLAHVGGTTDANHLRKSGWLPFLQSLKGEDTALWHQIATDFHDMLIPDHMGATLWILAQPSCDRATAAGFIRGFVRWECLLSAVIEAARSGDPWMVEGFRAVIHRWNPGFYQSRRTDLSVDLEDGGTFTQARLVEMLAEACARGRLLPFPEPVGVSLPLAPGGAGDPKIWRSGYEYLPGEGLCLSYPGAGWADGPG